MSVLAEIRWCDTHGKSVIVADDPPFCTWGESIWESALCVVVDAQVTHTTADPTPRPDKQPCPDCDDYAQIPDGNYDEEAGEQTWRACPTCVVCPDCGGTGTQAGMSLPVDPPRPAPCPSCSVEPKQTVPNTRGQHDDQPRRVMKPTLFADHVPDEIHSERKYWMNARAALRVLKPILPKRCPEDEALHDLHDPLPHKKCGGRGWLYPDPPEGFNETYGDIAWTLHCRIIWRAMGILNE